MRPRVLNLAEVEPFPGVLGPLEAVADVATLPPVRAEVLRRIGDVEAIVASLHLRLDREILEAAPRLRAIATPSTGLDHVDLDAARERGVAVFSLREEPDLLEGITATAELAWALLLAVARRLPEALEAARGGRWPRDRLRGNQLAGRTLGVLGHGRLGRMVAGYGEAFRMRVLACDPRPEARRPDGPEFVPFDRLFSESDAVSVHVHLSEETRGLVDARAIGLMKRGAVLINTSRGAVVDEAALLAALRDGRLGGAGLDVIDGEWNDDLAGHPMIRFARAHGNLVISPHIGGVTFESQRLALERTVCKLAEFLRPEGSDSTLFRTFEVGM